MTPPTYIRGKDPEPPGSTPLAVARQVVVIGMKDKLLMRWKSGQSESQVQFADIPVRRPVLVSARSRLLLESAMQRSSWGLGRGASPRGGHEVDMSHVKLLTYLLTYLLTPLLPEGVPETDADSMSFFSASGSLTL